MRYQHVAIESLGYTLPSEVVSTAQLEQQLEPAYQRMRLPEGRLELMTGIRHRRFLRDPGTLPGDKSIESGEQAIQVADIDQAENRYADPWIGLPRSPGACDGLSGTSWIGTSSRLHDL